MSPSGREVQVTRTAHVAWHACCVLVRPAQRTAPASSAVLHRALRRVLTGSAARDNGLPLQTAHLPALLLLRSLHRLHARAGPDSARIAAELPR